MPYVEQELSPRGQMIGGHLECRLQSLIGRLVAHDMKQGNDRVEATAEACRADITDFAGKGASSFRRPRAHGCLRNRHHLCAPLDAMNVKAHGCEETAVSTGARAELKDGARGWHSRPNQSRNVFGFRGIALVAVK